MKQADDVGRVLPHLELAQPDEAADVALNHLRKQAIEAGFHGFIQPSHDGAIDLTFRRDMRTDLVPLHDWSRRRANPEIPLRSNEANRSST